MTMLPDEASLEPIVQYAVAVAGLQKLFTLCTANDDAKKTTQHILQMIAPLHASNAPPPSPDGIRFPPAGTSTPVDVASSLREAFAESAEHCKVLAAATAAALESYVASLPLRIHEGSKVLIHSIKSKPELNGVVGTVRKDAGERWSIYDGEGAPLGNIKPANLTVLPHLDTAGPDGVTPMLMTCAQKRWDAFEALQILGSNLNLVGKKFNDVKHGRQRTPLMAVVESGNVEQVKKMLAIEEVDLTATNDKGADVFDMAIQNGDPTDADATVMRLLLQHGADPNSPDPKQSPSERKFDPPLSRAAVRGSMACVKALLDHDADVNKVHGIEERTALVEAVLCMSSVDAAAQLAVATLLVEHGANVNHTTSEHDHKETSGIFTGATPLILAAARNQMGMVKLLIKHGASPNILSSSKEFGVSALHAIAMRGTSMKIAKYLLENGADPRLHDVGASKISPLMMAVYGGVSGVPESDLAKLFLQYGADPDEADTDDNCLLWHAANFDLPTIAAVILAYGADPNKVCSKSGVVPLDRAAVNGYIEVAALLLAYGANPSHAYSTGTPMYESVGCFAENPAERQETTTETWVRLHQLLAVYGASSTSPVAKGKLGGLGVTTTLALAKKKSLLVSQAWFEMMGQQVAPIADSDAASTFHGYWSPLRVAAHAQMHQHGASALKLGRIDPELDSFTLWNKLPVAEQTMSAADAVVADALAIRCLAQSAQPPCLQTIKFVRAATSGWSPETHWMHHRAFRAAVHAVLLTNERLYRNAEGNSSADPVLPPELWLHLLGFCLRRDWQVDINVGSCVEIIGLQGRADLNGKKGFVQSKNGQRWMVELELEVAPMPPRTPGHVPFGVATFPQDKDGQMIVNGYDHLEFNPDQNGPETVSIKATNLKAVSSQHFMTPGV